MKRCQLRIKSIGRSRVIASPKLDLQKLQTFRKLTKLLRKRNVRLTLGALLGDREGEELAGGLLSRCLRRRRRGRQRGRVGVGVSDGVSVGIGRGGSCLGGGLGSGGVAGLLGEGRGDAQEEGGHDALGVGWKENAVFSKHFFATMHECKERTNTSHTSLFNCFETL